MEFKISKSGTVTECREALNAAIAALPLPRTTEHDVVRAIANHIVVECLDPIHDPWVAKCNQMAGVGLKKQDLPPEPKATISVNCEINFTATQ